MSSSVRSLTLFSGHGLSAFIHWVLEKIKYFPNTIEIYQHSPRNKFMIRPRVDESILWDFLVTILLNSPTQRLNMSRNALLTPAFARRFSTETACFIAARRSIGLGACFSLVVYCTPWAHNRCELVWAIGWVDLLSSYHVFWKR